MQRELETEASAFKEIEETRRELGEVPPSTPREMEEAYETLFEEERRGVTVKKVLRMVIVGIVCILVALIALYSVIDISSVREAKLSAYVGRCVGIWIRSIIMTQAVVIIGGIFFFLLREPRETKA